MSAGDSGIETEGDCNTLAPTKKREQGAFGIANKELSIGRIEAGRRVSQHDL